LSDKLAPPADTCSEAAVLIDQLEQHVLDSSGGWANEPALKGFKDLARQVLDKIGDRRGREQLEAACGWAEILYSSCRHRRRRRGVGQMHQLLLDHLRALRQSLS
jgi:hypothetical protein